MIGRKDVIGVYEKRPLKYMRSARKVAMADDACGET